MSEFSISVVSVLKGQVGLSPAPGRFGAFDRDLQSLNSWQPSLVVSLIEPHEYIATGAQTFGTEMAQAGIQHLTLPIKDFDVPSAEQMPQWAQVSQTCLDTLGQGGRVLVHCMGGCGRSGMVALRLMILAGEDADAALSRLRQARPCAIETDAQMQWAFG